ncbi:MAG: lipopolysaccharide kinase InaA family protein [Gemmataceae bacterium]
MLQTVEVTVAGTRWLVAAQYRNVLLDDKGLRLDEWLRMGQAQIVKHGHHRTVYHVVLPEMNFYLKHYRLPDLQSWFRQMIRPPKARREYQRALAVAERGVPTIAPLALGERMNCVGAGESYLITQSKANAEPLNVFLETVLPRLEPGRQAQVRQLLAVEMGNFMAHMHSVGVVHLDLHPGNLLVRLIDDAWPALYLIDLHDVRLGHPPCWSESRANLVVLNRWFMLRAGRTDRLRFWKAYWQTRCRADQYWTGLGEDAHSPGSICHRLYFEDWACELERRTWISNLWFWRARDRRYLRDNRYYRHCRAPGMVGHIVRDLDDAVVQQLLRSPEEPFQRPDVKVWKQSAFSHVAEFELINNGVSRPVVYKAFRRKSWKDPWSGLVQCTAALRSWVFGHGLRDRGLPTARPLAVLHRRRWGLLREGYLLMEKIANACDLHQFMARLIHLPETKRRAVLWRTIEQVAQLVRDLHARQLSHRDLKATNVLVAAKQQLEETANTNPNSLIVQDAEPSSSPRAYRPLCVTQGVWLIDLVGVSRHWRLPYGRRVQNLARLHASFHQHPGLTRTDKLRFLRTYLQWGLRGQDGWKNWWRDIDQATQAKVARNRRRGRVLT